MSREPTMLLFSKRMNVSRLVWKQFMELDPSLKIAQTFNLITLQLGPNIMVAVKAKMTRVESPDQLIENINVCEAALKEHFHDVQWIFFEPDVKE